MKRVLVNGLLAVLIGLGVVVFESVPFSNSTEVAFADHKTGHPRPPGCDRRSERGREQSPNCEDPGDESP